MIVALIVIGLILLYVKVRTGSLKREIRQLRAEAEEAVKILSERIDNI